MTDRAHELDADFLTLFGGGRTKARAGGSIRKKLGKVGKRVLRFVKRKKEKAGGAKPKARKGVKGKAGGARRK